MAKLIAYMNGIEVGTLEKARDGAHSFTYADSWLNHEKRRPLSLSLPLQKGKLRSDKVINYFDNLLPDNPDVRRHIMQLYQVKTNQPFDILSEIGKDSVGAVSLLPPDVPYKKQELSFDMLDEAGLEQVLQNYQVLGMGRQEEEFRISVAGMQAKTALLKIGDKWCLPKGQTPTSHILKLPLGQVGQGNSLLDLSNSVENEYLCLMLARNMGFPVPDAEIVQAGTIKALAVERFDRKWNKSQTQLTRLPQEDMCQALGKPASLKYDADGGISIEDVMQLLEGSETSFEDRANFMSFQIFQWILGATDGHGKNFSVFLGKEGSYRLTPFYDVISAYPMLKERKKLKLAMGLRGSQKKRYSLDEIYPRHFMQTAKSFGMSNYFMWSLLMDLSIMLPKAIKDTRAALPADFPQDLADCIFANCHIMLKRLEMGLEQIREDLKSLRQ